MATTTKSLGAVKRFGVRYGRTPKHNMARIEDEQRKKQKCPYCLKNKVIRLATGIWQCNKCNAKFTGNAYYLGAKPKEQAEEQTQTVEKEELQPEEEELEVQKW